MSIITACGLGDLDLKWRQNNHKQTQHVHTSVILIDLSQFTAHHGCDVCMLQYKVYMGILLKKILPRRVSSFSGHPWTYINK